MENRYKMNIKIHQMRQALQDLIDEKQSLLDPEVIIASQKLDETLNEYYNLFQKK